MNKTKKKAESARLDNDGASRRVEVRERRGSDPKDRGERAERVESQIKENKRDSKHTVSKRVGREMRPIDPRVDIPAIKAESKFVPRSPTKPPAPTGKVTVEFPNGDVYPFHILFSYEGFALNDKKHGPNGSYVFNTGDIYAGEWAVGLAHGRGSLTFVKAEALYLYDAHEDLWAHGACLRLVPSVSFQLTGFDDERERASKKSSVVNMLDDWKQVIGAEDPPQAGIYTVEYLYERLLNEGDSKCWLSWLYFCSKWEKSGYGSTSMFLAFPDLARGCFMSLTQVLISSGLLEKLVMKYITSQPSPSSGFIFTPLPPSSSSSLPSTPTSSDIQATITPTPSSDTYDTEVQKLFSLCLDLGDDENLIQATIKKLKATRDYVRPLLTIIPPYFSHSLAHSISVFKKSHSSALHFLSQKTIALEKRIFMLASLPPPPVPASTAPNPQRVSSVPSILPAQLRLLLQFYKERAQFSLFENLETAPRVVEKVLTTSGVLQAFVERKIAALEREDTIFSENMEELRQSKIKENEHNENSAEMYLQLYVQDKSSTFKILAEEHKRDVQMMEYIRKACEELYKLLYNKAIDNTLSSFSTAKSLIEKVVSSTSDKEILEICAQIAAVVSRQVSELHRIIHFYATFTTEKQNSIDVYMKELNAISQKIQDILHPPPPEPVTSPGTPSYLSMALNFTKGILKNVTQYIAEDTSNIDKSQVEAHTYKPINIRNLKSDTVLLAALLRDHTDSELVAKFTAAVLVHMCDLLASAILCLQDSPYAELRAASLNILQAHYSQDDEHRKEFVVNFMSVLVNVFEASLKELSPPIGTAVCDLLGALTNGTDEIKAAVVTKIGIKKLIDLMDIGARQPQGEAVVYSAAQVLANIAAKEEYLVEISSKGGLHRVLEVAKVGKIKAHMHIPEDQLQLGETLGTGTFAEVKKGLWQDKAVAIKIFREAAFTFRLEDFWKEVAIMSLIKHENILRLLGASIAQRKENSTFMLVTELMHKGTLRDIIRTVGPLGSPMIVKYALDVALGLAYMHTLDILHRDIKASNILVDEEDRAKVGDLGLSRVNNNLNMTQFTGTPKWEAPECLISSQYSKSADVYSYGVVLSEMVTGEEPFPEINDLGELKKAVVDQKLRPKVNPKASNCPPFLTSLIKACWSHDPKKRPTFEQIVELLSAPPLNQ